MTRPLQSSSASPPSSRKRQRVESSSSDDVADENDTFLALRKLHDEFYGDGEVAVPQGKITFVLVHHLYSVLSNRTATDRELASLQRENRVRLLKIQGVRADDLAVLATTQYLEAAEASGISELAIHVLKELVNAQRGLFVSGPGARAVAEGCVKRETAGKDVRNERTDGGDDDEELKITPQQTARAKAALSELVSAGFVLPRRDVAGEDAYWFFAPGLGLLSTNLRRGRTEIGQIVKRRKFKEIKLSELRKVKLRQTNLPLSFLVRDSVALGLLSQVQTPSGAFVRLLQAQGGRK